VRLFRLRNLAFLTLVLAVPGAALLTASSPTAAFPQHDERHVIRIPDTDAFVPFHLTVHVGDKVTWINSDTDDHTVVSNDAFNTDGHRGLNVLIPGTDNNGGKPGVFSLRFFHPGTFLYFCRFHAKLDANSQPIAPGPDGGIQDANGNFGTPMNGIISIRPFGDD
jgi:plastocyanin